MSSTTRLLVLGVVKLFQPVHGYEVRRELLSWRAQEWASVQPGSIYNALKTLTRDGLLEVASTDQVGGRPERTTYRLPQAGAEEFRTLLREEWWTVRPPADPLMAAVSFLGEIPRAEAIRYGTIERMWVTPASRLGLLLGRVLRDTLVLLVQATLLTLIAVGFGLRVPLAGALITVGIVGLLSVSLASLSYAAGLWLKSEDALAPLLNMVSVPVLLLSGILLPMTLAPPWLRRLSELNPFSHIVDAARAAFRNDLGEGSLVVGLICAAALAVVGLAVATRTFRRESA